MSIKSGRYRYVNKVKEFSKLNNIHYNCIIDFINFKDRLPKYNIKDIFVLKYFERLRKLSKILNTLNKLK